MNLSQTKEEMGRLHGEMQAVLSKAENEKRTLNSEENQKWSAMDDRMVELCAHKELLEKQSARDAQLRSLSPIQLETIGGGSDSAKGGDEKKARADKYTAAFKKYVQFGFARLSSDEQNMLHTGGRYDAGDPQAALSPATGSSGGFLIPQGFEDSLTEARKWFGGIDQFSDTVTTDTGNPLPFPTANDTTNTGEIVGPNVQVTQAYPSFNSVVLGAYKFSSKLVLVPTELLQDSAFDLNTWIPKTLGVRLARIENTKFTVGTGSSEPTGVVTAAAAAGNVVTMGAGNTASITTDAFYDLEGVVDKAYRQGARYMLSDTTLRLVKKLKDSSNRPLWQPGLAATFAEGSPATINGYEYIVNNDMPAPGASNYIMAFGDYTNFKVRRVNGYEVLRLTERYADYGQVGFLCFERADSNLIDAGAHPVALLQNSAT